MTADAQRITVRGATWLDVPRATKLVRDSFPDMSPAELGYCCRERLSGMDLAFDGRRLIGVIVTTPRPAQGLLWIDAIAVAPAARGLGLGRAMLEHVEQRAAAGRLREVALATRRDNHSAQRLYERAGYVRVEGETPALWRYARLVGDHAAAPPPDPAVGASRLAQAIWKLTVRGRRVEQPSAPMSAPHRLADHPVFDRAALRGLLAVVPGGEVEIREACTDPRARTRGERLGMPAVEAFDALEDRPLWINVHRAERFSPELRQLRDQRLEELAGLDRSLSGELDQMGFYLILSSPGAVVHYHADPDDNVLHQIRGSKTVVVYPSETLPEFEAEALAHTGDQGVVSYDPAYDAQAWPDVILRPGDAVALPAFHPHRVMNHGEVSVSLAFGFLTRQTRDRHRVHAVNRRLRARGVPVSPVGRHPWLDLAIARLHEATRPSMRRAIRGMS